MIREIFGSSFRVPRSTLISSPPDTAHTDSSPPLSKIDASHPPPHRRPPRRQSGNRGGTGNLERIQIWQGCTGVPRSAFHVGRRTIAAAQSGRHHAHRPPPPPPWARLDRAPVRTSAANRRVGARSGWRRPSALGQNAGFLGDGESEQPSTTRTAPAGRARRRGMATRRRIVRGDTAQIEPLQGRNLVLLN